MGHKARLRAKRREPLPRYIDSPTFGLVDTQDFKGCQVAEWDFDDDQPRALLDPNTKQVHINRRYIDPALDLQLLMKSMNELHPHIETTKAEYTSF